ncbi:MAG: hypothetical protein ABFS43_14760 [Thermodesulfobacteriota bacterium]
MSNQTPVMFFKMLDLDEDGFLSRSDLNKAAKRLGWSWHEAPLLAVLDLLSITKPIPKSEFVAFIHKINTDPLGPYGDILLKSPHFLQPTSLQCNRISNEETAGTNNRIEIQKQERSAQPDFDKLTGFLEKAACTKDVVQYQSLLETLEIACIPAEDAALLIIDPQRSFTEGAWMHSIGYGADSDVIPIRLAFNNCAAFLARHYGQMEIMFTRCPFPANSYGWTGPISNVLHLDQLYFIKPGNSVLFPHTNGFRQWVDSCMDHGKKALVIVGCTLNSCVRVSSIETSKKFRNRNLQVIVDLSLSGARAKNYISSPAFNGLSAVESAVVQMLEEGVQVVRHVKWK